MSNVTIALLIPVAALAAIVLGGMLILKVQKRTVEGVGPHISSAPGGTASSGFQQSPGESREAFVRRNWQRPAVVANGPTLLDLYDRINELERRLAETERRQPPAS